ncbi:MULTISPECIES: sensor histidine kinase [Acinetobacter]|uniref:sensor histidine kinase n=1 Tax=Acinetobacter TaxID=469 RepID=UPI00097F8D22|nr:MULTISPECIES: HAMP domain-containing sensor histidine kinase [Acinetobacter]MEB3795546.1 HAMP domain-containing histidine kinase [Acinetobacter sp. IK24]MEB3814695.1 HAMP domain-containing histidine kinase [Acinetobacter sp. IK22]MEB3833869.1 HAMP domain-containing histidine kinase [Acinetobacter sp. IK23]MEB3837832.1 HAMP domain-containing histidine kinase [Acinetobacter sp. IK25]ONN57479.1 histidine kinase [Acinetobacter genomosp. 33YU]
MTFQRLELHQIEQLSACRISLLLGLNAEQNYIEQFFRFSLRLLKCQKALLTFNQEPYFWHRCPEGITAISFKPSKHLKQCFAKQQVINHLHPSYQNLTNYLKELNIECSRALAVHLFHPDKTSMGFAVFFDDDAATFEDDDIQLLLDYCSTFMQQVELKFNYEELNELYEQQVAINSSKTKFFSIISHDLRAPFHGLLGFSEVLAKERETLDESSIQNIADYLYETSQSTYNLLESLLTWAMAEGGRFVYHPINFKLRQVSNIVCDVLRTLAIKKNIELVNDVPEDLNIYADINMMTSVIQNLVSNALKFTDIDGSGKVFIEARQADKNIEITVRDTGLGMTEQQIKNLFHPRITASFKGTAGEKGAGLGLSLCKRFIEINQGQINVGSKEGVGTTFKVLLPSAQESHDALTEHHSSPEAKLV